MIGEACEIERVRCPGQLAGLGEFERSRSAEIDVEPLQGRGNADVERLHEAPQIAGERARGLDRAGHRGREQRAGVDRDDVVGTRAHEADLVGRPMGKAGVKGRPAPPCAMRVDQRPDARFDPGAPQGLDDEPALPLAVEGVGHVLRGAAPAAAEPGAVGFGALRTFVHDLDEFGAPPREPYAGALARKRAGNGRAALRDAVAACVERHDLKVAGRFSSWRAASRNSFAPPPPSTGDGIMPSTVQPSAATKALTSSQARASAASLLTRPLTISAGPTSNCGLTRLTSHAGRGRELEHMRQDEPLRDEAQVADDRARRLADVLERQLPRVETLERTHPRVGGKARVQLPMADVDRDHASCAPRKQHIGEAAGRGADVEAGEARRVESECVERGGELHAAARSPGMRRGGFDRGVPGDLVGGLFERDAANADEPRRDRSLRARPARKRSRARREQYPRACAWRPWTEGRERGCLTSRVRGRQSRCARFSPCGRSCRPQAD